MKKYISKSLLSQRGRVIFFVKKKDGSLRPCIDLLLMSPPFLTKLDLRDADHLVHIMEENEWKTGFSTPRRNMEYCVLPFIVSNAPTIFQALVNDVLRDVLDQFIYVHLNGILVFSCSLQKQFST